MIRPPCRSCGLVHGEHELRCSLTGRPLEAPAGPPSSLVLAAANRPRELIGRVLGGAYRPTSIIAEGGMGTVYEAEQLRTGRVVALKALHPAFAHDRELALGFRLGARAAGSIAHPNVCAVYDAGELDDGRPYLVMDRLRGETLADRIEREGPLPPADAAGVARQALYALSAVHAAGVVHCDVKPDNLFLAGAPGSTPFVKLLDFDLSRAEGGPACAATVAGTPAYMAPEQARGEAVDARTDLYALGVVLYECLSGQCPIVAPNGGALFHLIASDEPPPPHALGPPLPGPAGPLVRKAIEKAPSARFQTAREFSAALAALDAWACARPRRASCA